MYYVKKCNIFWDTQMSKLGKITPFLGVKGQRGHQSGSTPISREHARRICNKFASIHFFVGALFRPLMARTDWRTDGRTDGLTDRITFIVFLGGLFQCKDPTAYAAGNMNRKMDLARLILLGHLLRSHLENWRPNSGNILPKISGYSFFKHPTVEFPFDQEYSL